MALKVLNSAVLIHLPLEVIAHCVCIIELGWTLLLVPTIPVQTNPTASNQPAHGGPEPMYLPEGQAGDGGALNQRLKGRGAEVPQLHRPLLRRTHLMSALHSRPTCPSGVESWVPRAETCSVGFLLFLSLPHSHVLLSVCLGSPSRSALCMPILVLRFCKKPSLRPDAEGSDERWTLGSPFPHQYLNPT